MKTFILSLCFISITACAPIQRPTHLEPGELAPAPQGWIDFCKRHPQDEACKR